jgi:hypothetical protein
VAERSSLAPAVGLRSSGCDRTLSGPSARMHVLRRIRRSFPKGPRTTLDELVEEVLTP